MDYKQFKKDIEEVMELLKIEKNYNRESVYEKYTKGYKKYIQRKQPVFINPFEYTPKRTKLVSRSELVKR